MTNGDSYTMDVVIPPDPDPTTLPDHTFASVTMPDLTGVPDEVSTLASDWAGAGGASYAQLVALVETLKRGAFSDGDAQSGVNAPAGHGAKRVRDFLAGDQLVGDSEQYAAVLALMSRELGMPARVVLGVVPPAAGFTGQVTGAMVSAWVEVDFAGLGWVPFDPTPPVTSLPKKQQVKPQTNPQGTVLDPPILAAQPPVPLPPPQAQEPVPAQECLIGWLCFNLLPRWVQLVIEYVGGPLLLITLTMLSIISAKGVRRRRRRRRGPTPARVSGAWHELLDRLRDNGIRTTAYDTRHDICDRVGGEATRSLASLTDAAIFGPGDPTETEVKAVWSAMPRAAREILGPRGRWRRLLAAVNPRSLRPRRRGARPTRSARAAPTPAHP